MKLLKILAVNTTQALELGTVATSGNRQRCHHQSQWAWLKPSLIVMDAIDAIIVKCQSAHETCVPLMQRGEPWQSTSEPQGGLADNATKASWGRHEYHKDTHPATTIIIKGASIAATQMQRMQPITRRSSKWETSGRLGIFMPQISRDENTKNNNKTRNEELAKNNKKYGHVTLAPRVRCPTLAGGATHTINWHRPEQQQNKSKLKRQQWR